MGSTVIPLDDDTPGGPQILLQVPGETQCILLLSLSASYAFSLLQITSSLTNLYADWTVTVSEVHQQTNYWVCGEFPFSATNGLTALGNLTGQSVHVAKLL
jgi:hypothetical protein